MKVLIDISQEMFKATQTYYSNNTTRLSIKSCIEKIADGTPIPEGATNGDMLLTMFDTATVYGIDKENDCIAICIDNNFYQKFRYSWWNAPYKEDK